MMATVVIFLVGFGCVLAVLAHRFEPFLRARIVQGLQDRFRTHVEMDNFHVALGNGLHGEFGIWATGQGLRIWPPHRTGGDHPLETAVQSLPLIQLKEFRFHVPMRYESGKPVKISLVRLSGLKIDIPPRSERDKYTGFESAMGKQKSSPSGAGHAVSHPAPPVNEPSNSGTQSSGDQSSSAGVLSNVLVQRIECDNTELILETDKPDKLPLAFEIAHLQLRNVRAGGPMEFTAELTNPRPKGVIHTTGNLGPWQAGDPGETAISGKYAFDHADLSVFKGIAGILSSTGNFSGTLHDIVVDGKADVPDFSLSHFGNSLPLHTQFHARVDGTDGDTWLEPVDATLGRSHFTTKGKIVRVRTKLATGAQSVSTANLPPLADGGHDIDLAVNVDRGRIEDFLKLATRAQAPLLTGSLAVRTTLHIPPGRDPVHQRMQLDGHFKLDEAHFTDAKFQDKIQELSLRGQGKPGAIKTTDANDTTSEMEGSFHMANAAIGLPDLQYNVPGASIQLKGTYPLDGFMHFDGTVKMQATVSQAVGGWKGFLLKPADRFFKKDGAGTVVAIQIRGPHDAPEFGVDFGRMKKTSPQSPGQKQQN
ncbi:MAG TPA: hypothetical protein VGG85_16740 [Terracidiphilus sp.]|jgi:hypothetical protein